MRRSRTNAGLDHRPVMGLVIAAVVMVTGVTGAPLEAGTLEGATLALEMATRERATVDVAARDGAAQGLPATLEVPPGHVAFLTANATGTQNYICLPAGTGAAWVHLGPQATLFAHAGQQVTSHYLSVNPVEGVARAAWRHSADSSQVWARAIASSSDPTWVAPGAVPWLLLEVVGAEAGSRSGKLTATRYIQRLQTAGGVAPATGCLQATDVGARAFVPYETVYVFHRVTGQ